MEITHTSTFTIPEKYSSKKDIVDLMIAEHDGDISINESKDGTYYSVEFTSLKQGRLFDERMSKLIPDLYEY
ncbi:hypothetical protein GGR22_000727 [Flavobacterium gossypii]|uniref:Uncharacterized protein n=1 Tax=Flavobacterium gossypii TaxID=1646119 RepID=A0ABR6DLN9_9FLAO|nr:hypothetical protein [Flavobacterium gossypii]MBA9072601.1 hypothetical protein [Flavobacterium gossypii]